MSSYDHVGMDLLEWMDVCAELQETSTAIGSDIWMDWLVLHSRKEFDNDMGEFEFEITR